MPLKYRSACPHPGTQTDAERAESHAKIKASAERTKRRLEQRDAVVGAPKPTTADPLDPGIDRWLRSIEPRLELVVRYAMKARWPTVRGNRKFAARVTELEESTGIRRDEDRLAMVIADARLVQNKIEELIEGQPRRR
jgi:hypothetical protein